MAPRALAALLLSLLPLAGALSSRAVKPGDSGVPAELRDLVVNPNVTDPIPNSYMVVLKSDISPGDLEAMQKTVQAKVKRHNVQRRGVGRRALSDEVETCSINSWHAFKVEGTPEMLRELAQDPQVKAIEANARFGIPEMRSADALVKRKASPVVPCQPQRRANSTKAALGNPCLMCILDSGVNNHTEFGNRLLKAKNFSRDPSGADGNGHGTHVAALAAGATLSETPNCMVLPVKILGDDGGGDVMSIARGLKSCSDTMKEMNLTSATANLSVGGPKSSCVNAAVNEAAKLGVVSVTAAGNDGKDAQGASPASADSAIAVGAVDNRNRVTDFSDIGPKVQIFALGKDVCSASNQDPNAFRQISGTSQASPQVASDVAKKLSQDTSRAKPNVTDILESIQNDARKADSEVEPQVDGRKGTEGAEPLVLPDS